MLVEVVAQQQPVDDDQLAQFRLRAGREERRQPDQRPLPFVLVSELVEPVQVLGRRVPFGVEREVDDQLPVVRGPQRFVGQAADVGEQHVAGPPAPPPQERVRDEHLVLLGDAQRLEEHLPDLELAVAEVVVDPADSMMLSVSTPESWIETVGLVGSSPTRISPTMPAHVRSFWATT